MELSAEVGHAKEACPLNGQLGRGVTTGRGLARNWRGDASRMRA